MVVAAAEERAVGGGGQRGLHLFLGLLQVLPDGRCVVQRVFLVGNLLESREELVAVGHIARRDARCQQ